MKRIIIDNIETKYLISENGEVFSEYKNIFLKSSTTQHGYSSVTLSVNGKKIRKYIHRLVAEYYLGFQEKGGRVINHIDGNKLNNNFSNLRCVSKSENTKNAFYEQKLSKNCKPVIAYKDGVKIGEYPSIAKAAECLQLDGSSISKVCKNKQKTIHGYTFKYLEKGSTVIS